MLSIEQNERLTRVGPGTPMGELMRRYWQPIAVVSELRETPTKSIRLLGESLVLYKDRKGRLGLIEEACAHRRVNLIYGIPENEGLRCPYHGWLFDQKGRCLEMPAEPADSTFKNRVKMKAYPVEQLGGLVFAYMGPEPVPLVPRWEPFVRNDVIRDVGWAVVPCNWLQIMENSLDPVHGEYLHRYFTNYVLERLGYLEDKGDLRGPEGAPGRPRGATPANYWRTGAKVVHHTKVNFKIFEHGITKHRLLQGESEETSPSWLIGHPILFPNFEHGAGGGGFQIRVPMDDTNTYYLWYNCHPASAEEAAQQSPQEVPVYRVPLPGMDQSGTPAWQLLDNNSGQDNMAWTSQGPVTQRHLENLGQSDAGIILFRQLLNEQMKVVEDGGEPMNVFRNPATNQRVTFPYEGREGAGDETGDVVYGYARRTVKVSTGTSGKYSPINLERAKKAGSPLPQPVPPIAAGITASGGHKA
jgi:5,5'-dehydrodivanillate O-demethylase